MFESACEALFILSYINMEDYVSNCKISPVKRALSGMSVKQNKLNTTNRTENEALSTLNNAIIEVKQ